MKLLEQEEVTSEGDPLFHIVLSEQVRTQPWSVFWERENQQWTVQHGQDKVAKKSTLALAKKFIVDCVQHEKST